MEPVTTTIVAALAAGAVAAAKDVAADAIKSAYDGLKSLIVKKFGDKEDVKDALENMEKKPESKGRQQTLEEEVDAAKIGEDREIVKMARELLALLEEHGEKPSESYHAELHGDGAIAQGPGH